VPWPNNGRPVAAELSALTAAAGERNAAATICAALADSEPEYVAALAPMVRVNWSWNAATRAATAWYSPACWENTAAIAADTSSCAAAATPVVGPAAAAWLLAKLEPILSRFAVTHWTTAGSTFNGDVMACHLMFIESPV
jgi:hypothetical protein